MEVVEVKANLYVPVCLCFYMSELASKTASQRFTLFSNVYLQKTELAVTDIWFQTKRDSIDQDILFAQSMQSGFCCCTHFPFHLLSESRPCHHLFSLFLVQHLSISPCLFISLPGCACKFECVRWSGCYSLKVVFHLVFFLFILWLSLLFRYLCLPGETSPF